MLEDLIKGEPEWPDKINGNNASLNEALANIGNTIDSLNANLLTKVGLTEDQAIKGKNTFTQNIEIPLLPADEAHAVSKYYLDESRTQKRIWRDFNFSGGAQSGRLPLKYSNSGGIAAISGDIIFSAGSSAAIGVLPVGYRPSVITVGFAVVDSWYGSLNSVVSIQINPQGIVTRMEPIIGALSNSVGYLFYLPFPAEQ